MEEEGIIPEDPETLAKFAELGVLVHPSPDNITLPRTWYVLEIEVSESESDLAPYLRPDPERPSERRWWIPAERLNRGTASILGPDADERVG